MCVSPRSTAVPARSWRAGYSRLRRAVERILAQIQASSGYEEVTFHECGKRQAHSVRLVAPGMAGDILWFAVIGKEIASTLDGSEHGAGAPSLPVARGETNSSGRFARIRSRQLGIWIARSTLTSTPDQGPSSIVVLDSDGSALEQLRLFIVWS